MNSFGSAQILRPLTLLLGVGWLIFIFLKSQIPADPGDGIQHFFYAQASWEEPSYFLHHWGKPLFILLSSPFAQLGFSGMVIFNILIYALTVILGYRILDRFKVEPAVQALLPLILIIAKDYSITVLGGMTEVLFNLAIVSAAFLFLNKQFRWFAILVSFMPYMRSEGQLPVILGCIMLIYWLEWRSIPFLFTGHLFYALPGLLVYNDLLWYFSESPYSIDDGIYGKGSYGHYLISYRNYIDNTGLIVFISGTLALFYRWIKGNLNKELVSLGFLSYGIFFGVIAAHSYFWANGMNGSMGLTRLATQGMPLFILVNLILISGLPAKWNMGINIISVVMSAGIVVALASSKKFPIQPTELEQTVIIAARSKTMLNNSGSKYFNHHPLFAFELGDNPVLEDSRALFFQSFDIEREKREIFKPGDLIIWDSHFGPAEMNIPLEALENDTTRILKLEEFNSVDLVESNGKEPGKVVIFQVKGQR